MYCLEITGGELDSFYIPIKELMWRPLRPVGEMTSLSYYFCGFDNF